MNDWLRMLARDFAFAMRSLRAHAGTSAFAVLTLATGLAAAIAIGAVIDAVLVRALPYPHSEQLVQIRELAADGRPMPLAQPNYDDLAASIEAFTATAQHADWPGTIRSGERALRAPLDSSGGAFFATLGAAPAIGRTFSGGEHERVVVIADSLWRGLLQTRPDVLGSSIEIEGEVFTIIGVMPPQFAFPQGSVAWVPNLDPPGTSRSAHNWQAIGRLRTGADLEPARLAANALATRLKARFGDQTDAAAFDITPLRDAIGAPARNALLLLGAGIAFLLMIAVINTINLLLALHGARSRELAVRAALGASARRLARQILLEGVVLSAAATMLALGAAALALRALVAAAPDLLPRAEGIGLNAMLVTISAIAGLVIAMVSTAAVLWQARRNHPLAGLRESGRGHSGGRAHVRTRAALLVGQTALTTLLLIGAGLLGRSFLALLSVDAGFAAEGAASVQLTQTFTREPAAAAAHARFFGGLISTFAQLPGVTAVGGVNALPLTGGADGAFWDGAVNDFANAPKPIGYAEFRVASDDYFRAAGIPLLRGRTFGADDRADGTHVAVISAAAARAAWGKRDPIGQRIQMGNMDGDLHALTVVGVVGDVRESRLERAPLGTVYVDLAQRPLAAAEFNVVVRAAMPVASLVGVLRESLQREAGGIPYSLHALAEVRSDALASRRLSLLLLGAFAAIALVLAVGGVYGLMAFSVGQRRHEFAVRAALGADARRIARLVLRGGLSIGGAGIALGMTLALLGAGVLRGFLYGVAPGDPLVFAGAGALLLATLVLACLLPARRACAVAPREALA